MSITVIATVLAEMLKVLALGAVLALIVSAALGQARPPVGVRSAIELIANKEQRLQDLKLRS